MTFEEPSTQQVYRLIITRRLATEVMLTAMGASRHLPSINVCPAERLAVQLNAGARNCHGVNAYCLYVPEFSAEPPRASRAKYAVLESVEQHGNAPAGTEWMLVRSALSDSILSSDERDGLRISLDEMDRRIVEPSQKPFAKPGWIKELFEWIQDQVDPLQIRTTGRFEQLNSGPSFSLMRIETTGSAWWFKATGEPKRHEMPITRTLARLFPSCVPEILGVHSQWNGWLSRECDGATLDRFPEPSGWTRAAETLAQLEIASIGKRRELLECGCRDLTLPTLARQIDPFLARMKERMALQSKQPPMMLSDSHFAFLRDELKEACSALRDLDLPVVLGHLDFNPGNIVISPQRCVFLDWAEGSLICPFLTFAYLREHARRSQGSASESQAQMAAAYINPWRPLLSPCDLAQGIELSSFVAVFAYALAISEATPRETPESPTLAGFLRSLARRMYREAAELAHRSEQCRR